jgi:hypothetical protein
MAIPVKTKQQRENSCHAALLCCIDFGFACVLHAWHKRTGQRLCTPVSPQDLGQTVIEKESQKGYLQKISTVKEKMQQVKSLRRKAADEREIFRKRMQKENQTAA